MTRQMAEQIREKLHPGLWGTAGNGWVQGFLLSLRPRWAVRGTIASIMYSRGKRDRKRWDKRMTIKEITISDAIQSILP
mgnify:CR=1 FL=1